MRVTNGMIINTTLNSLFNNMNQLNKTYGQMTTGKKIQTVSDDPIIAGRALKLKTTVLETSQYVSNVEQATSWMEISDKALDNMMEILKSIRTKCLDAANGTLKKDDKGAVKTDIEELWKQLQQEANTTYDGRYVFSGYKTNEPLMKGEDLNPNVEGKIKGDAIEYEIGVNTTINVNVSDMDKTFAAMKTEFEGIISKPNDPTATGTAPNGEYSELVKKIDGFMKDISEKEADLGSRMKRLDYTKDRLSEQGMTFKNLLLQTESVDIEEVYTRFNEQYATYQSALQATSKIIKNTLADYL